MTYNITRTVEYEGGETRKEYLHTLSQTENVWVFNAYKDKAYSFTKKRADDVVSQIKEQFKSNGWREKIGKNMFLTIKEVSIQQI